MIEIWLVVVWHGPPFPPQSELISYSLDPNLEGTPTRPTPTGPQNFNSKQPSKLCGACRLHGHTLQDRPASVAEPLPAHTSAGKRSQDGKLAMNTGKIC